jgi:hypothetical protein
MKIGDFKMLIRSAAPLRLGLAGGGTDVSSYSDIFGGEVLNATIPMYAYTTIEQRDEGKIEIISVDRNESLSKDAIPELEIDGNLDLIKGVYNRIVRDFNKGNPLSFTIYTYKEFFYSLATQDKFSFEKDFLEKHYKNYEFYGFPFDEYFIDIGVPEDYERAKKEFEKFVYR